MELPKFSLVDLTLLIGCCIMLTLIFYIVRGF